MHSTPVIAHVLHSLEGGGTERTLLALLRAFDPNRFTHVVVPLREAGALATELPDHVACRPIRAKGTSRLTSLALGRTLGRIHASVVHARNSGTWVDSALACLLDGRMRLVLGHHGFDRHDEFDRRTRLRARIGLWAGGRFTAVSRSSRDQLHQQASIPLDRITVLANGIDFARFSDIRPSIRREIREALGVRTEEVLVGIVGSLSPVKRHELLFDAVAALAPRVPNLKLVVAGDGPYRGALEQAATTAGIAERTRFTGWFDDVPGLLAALDLFVCCSAAEGMSNALLEAMAAGAAIIATAVGDNGRLIRDGIEGRILTDPGPAFLAAAMENLIRKPQTAGRFGEAARLRARAFDFAKTVAAYETFYEGIVAGSRDESSAPLAAEKPRGAIAYPPTCARPAHLSPAAVKHVSRITRRQGVAR
jgi:glycosyltransferase involved in cell wall biosynthesis